MGQMLNLRAADGFECPAYLAQPSGPARGAVVVLQEIFGVNAHIRAVADGYAADGYLALAPATFSRVRPGVELGYDAPAMEQGQELKAQVEALPTPGVLQDVQAAIDHVAALVPGGKVGVLGYCWGGLLTWRAACELQGLSAAVPYYGGGMTVGAELARKARCPVLAHFGAQDHWITLDSVAAFQAAQPQVHAHIYAADHGFNCDHRAAYNGAAATLARSRTLAFLAQHLG